MNFLMVRPKNIFIHPFGCLYDLEWVYFVPATHNSTIYIFACILYEDEKKKKTQLKSIIVIFHGQLRFDERQQ